MSVNCNNSRERGTRHFILCYLQGGVGTLMSADYISERLGLELAVVEKTLREAEKLSFVDYYPQHYGGTWALSEKGDERIREEHNAGFVP